MKLTINIEKKHFYFISALIGIFGILTVFGATFDSSAPTHPLEQITIGGNSIDNDGNSIIDNADNLQGLSANDFCRSDSSNCLLGVWSSSGSDISFNTGNVDVTGDISSSGTICDSNGCIGDSGGGWPDGDYCIIQAEDKSCPAGFFATNPSAAGTSAHTPIYGGPVSTYDTVPRDRAKRTSGKYPAQEWAFCCRVIPSTSPSPPPSECDFDDICETGELCDTCLSDCGLCSPSIYDDINIGGK